MKDTITLEEVVALDDEYTAAADERGAIDYSDYLSYLGEMDALLA